MRIETLDGNKPRGSICFPAQICILIGLVSSACVGCSNQNHGTPFNPKRDIGFVLDVTGHWHVERSEKPLQLGDGILPGTVIRLGPESTPDANVIIALRSRKVLVIAQDGTKLPLTLDDKSENRFWTLAKRHYRDEFMSAQSRGDQPNACRDAVVSMEKGRMNLAPLFSIMPEKDYWISLTPGSSDELNAGAVETIKFSWSVDAPETEEVALVRNGIYRVTIWHDEPTSDQSKEPEIALILVCDPSRYRHLQSEFDQAVAQVASWGETVPSGVSRRFLRSILVGLELDSPRE